MPLKKNGVLIEELYELEMADAGDTRQRAFCNHEYIKGISGFGSMGSDAYITLRAQIGMVSRDLYKVNGEAAIFARKGCRPRFNLRAQITEIGKTYTLTKRSSDGAIVLIRGGEPQTEIIPGSLGARYVVVEVIGAGGGGSGGSAALNGVGGGAGAYYLAFIDPSDYDGYTFLITGGGGAGSSNRGKAGDGGNVEISVGSGTRVVGGGKGADGGTVGAGGQIDYFYEPLYAETGSNGYAGLSDDHTFEQITVRCGYEGETQCEKVYGPYTSNSNEAGAGGNSFFGAGGAPGNAYGDDGESPAATAYGAGGGGGRMKSFGSTTGGNGAGAVINIYY